MNLANDVASLNLDVSGITTIVAERTFWDKVTIIHGQRRWFERRGELPCPFDLRNRRAYRPEDLQNGGLGW